MNKLLLILTFLLTSTICFSQYKEFVPGPYRIGDTVQVSSKNSLFKAVKNFTAYSIPSDNQYWDFAGSMGDVKIKELEARLKVAEAEIVKQKATNLLFSESIASIEDRIDAVPIPIPVPVPVSGYLALPLSEERIINGQTNIVIENVRFENTANQSLLITNSSTITIRNCFFNKSAAEAIVIENSKNVTIEKCLFNGVTSGVYAATSQTIKVINNQFVNMRMRSDNSSRGQFVQFNNVTGAGSEVSGNKGENFPGESNPEDMISMFGGTSGTAASPILIKNNIGRGGGPSQSGGGIVAGDHSGSYITIDGNTLLNPGQYGIAIAGGSNNVITNNKIFSKQFPWSNNPLFIWMQAGSTVCANNTIKSNRVAWINRDGVYNDGWNAGNCTNTVWERPTRITEAEMGVPDHLIDFITPTELLKLRGK